MLIASFAIVPSTFASAATIAGKTCKKVDQIKVSKGSSFKCVKKGKRLLWSKEKETASAPKAPALTLREVWGSRSPDSLAVWDIIKPIPTDLTGPGFANVTYAFSSEIPLDSQEEIKRQYRLTTTYWARFTPISQRLHVAVSKTGDVRFLCTERAKFIRTGIDGCVQYNPGPRIGAYTMFDDGTGTFNWMTITPNLKDFEIDEKWTSHHEYVHSIQYSVNKKHWETHPCWFEEGMAMLFSPVLASEGKLGVFLKLRNKEARENVGAWRINPNPTVADWESWLWRASVPKYDRTKPGVDGCVPFSGRNPETGIYQVGLLAVEKIIFKVGMTGLFRLMTITGEQGWELAVKEVFGLSAKDLNAELAEVIHKETRIARNNVNLDTFCLLNPKDQDC